MYETISPVVEIDVRAVQSGLRLMVTRETKIETEIETETDERQRERERVL